MSNEAVSRIIASREHLHMYIHVWYIHVHVPRIYSCSSSWACTQTDPWSTSSLYLHAYTEEYGQVYEEST